MADSLTRRRWNCPKCGKPYSLKLEAQPPEVCPECKTASSTVPILPTPPIPIAAVPHFRSRLHRAAGNARTLIESDNPTWILFPLACTLILLVGASHQFENQEEDGAVAEITDANARKEPDAKAMFELATEFVRDRLKVPKTAEFAEFNPLDVHSIGPIDEPSRGWNVSGKVDAQNIYGAFLRSRFTVVFKFNAARKQMEVERAALDDTSLYESPEYKAMSQRVDAEIRAMEAKQVADQKAVLIAEAEKVVMKKMPAFERLPPLVHPDLPDWKVEMNFRKNWSISGRAKPPENRRIYEIEVELTDSIPPRRVRFKYGDRVIFGPPF